MGSCWKLTPSLDERQWNYCCKILIHLLEQGWPSIWQEVYKWEEWLDSQRPIWGWGRGEVNSLPHLPWLGTNHLVFLSLDLYLATFSESNMWDFHFVTGRNFQKSSQCQFRTFPMIFRRLLNIAEIVQSCSNELWALYPELFQRRNMLCYS